MGLGYPKEYLVKIFLLGDKPLLDLSLELFPFLILLSFFLNLFLSQCFLLLRVVLRFDLLLL